MASCQPPARHFPRNIQNGEDEPAIRTAFEDPVLPVLGRRALHPEHRDSSILGWIKIYHYVTYSA
jgi:hypothetical protein